MAHQERVSEQVVISSGQEGADLQIAPDQAVLVCIGESGGEPRYVYSGNNSSSDVAVVGSFSDGRGDGRNGSGKQTTIYEDTDMPANAGVQVSLDDEQPDTVFASPASIDVRDPRKGPLLNRPKELLTRVRELLHLPSPESPNLHVKVLKRGLVRTVAQTHDPLLDYVINDVIATNDALTEQGETIRSVSGARVRGEIYETVTGEIANLAGFFEEESQKGHGLYVRLCPREGDEFSSSLPGFEILPSLQKEYLEKMAEQIIRRNPGYHMNVFVLHKSDELTALKGFASEAVASTLGGNMRFELQDIVDQKGQTVFKVKAAVVYGDKPNRVVQGEKESNAHARTPYKEVNLDFVFDSTGNLVIRDWEDVNIDQVLERQDIEELTIFTVAQALKAEGQAIERLWAGFLAADPGLLGSLSVEIAYTCQDKQMHVFLHDVDSWGAALDFLITGTKNPNTERQIPVSIVRLLTNPEERLGMLTQDIDRLEPDPYKQMLYKQLVLRILDEQTASRHHALRQLQVVTWNPLHVDWESYWEKLGLDWRDMRQMVNEQAGGNTIESLADHLGLIGRARDELLNDLGSIIKKYARDTVGYAPEDVKKAPDVTNPQIGNWTVSNGMVLARMMDASQANYWQDDYLPIAGGIGPRAWLRILDEGAKNALVRLAFQAPEQMIMLIIKNGRLYVPKGLPEDVYTRAADSRASKILWDEIVSLTAPYKSARPRGYVTAAYNFAKRQGGD